MKINARELEGAPLDWAVAQVTSVELDIIDGYVGLRGRTPDGWPTAYSPSINWLQGGPLIEQHLIELHTNTGEQHGEHERWYAVVPVSASGSRGAMGPTPLIAAMRALVFAKLGDTVYVPEDLLS